MNLRASLPASVALAAMLAATPAFAANHAMPKTPDEARIVREMQAMQAQVGQDKRAFVDRQLALSPEAAARFWPVYDAHQVALAELNRRRLDNVLAYARAWNAGALDDATADTLARQALSLEKDEAALMQRTFERARKAVSPSQAARYLQVEAKIRAVARYEQAADVPLAK